MDTQTEQSVKHKYASQRAYYERNKEKYNEWHRAQNKKNPEKPRLRSMRCYYKKKGLSGGELEEALQKYQERLAERQAKKQEETGQVLA